MEAKMIKCFKLITLSIACLLLLLVPHTFPEIAAQDPPAANLRVRFYDRYGNQVRGRSIRTTGEPDVFTTADRIVISDDEGVTFYTHNKQELTWFAHYHNVRPRIDDVCYLSDRYVFLYENYPDVGSLIVTDMDGNIVSPDIPVSGSAALDCAAANPGRILLVDDPLPLDGNARVRLINLDLPDVMVDPYLLEGPASWIFRSDGAYLALADDHSLLFLDISSDPSYVTELAHLSTTQYGRAALKEEHRIVDEKPHSVVVVSVPGYTWDYAWFGTCMVLQPATYCWLELPPYYPSISSLAASLTSEDGDLTVSLPWVVPARSAAAASRSCDNWVQIRDTSAYFPAANRLVYTFGRATVVGTPGCTIAVVIDRASADNYAPYLDDTGDPSLAPILEDDDNNDGILVSDLIASVSPLDMIADPDAGVLGGPPALEGIAVIGVDNSHGRWEYSTYTRWVAWLPMHSPSAYRSLLLAADEHTRIRFVPDDDYSGTLSAGITFRAWDQTKGNNGDAYSTRLNGGRTAFSEGTETASVTVIPVNDSPSFVAGPDQTVNAAAGPQTIVNWATQIAAGPPNEIGQALTFLVSNDNPGLFAAPPAVAPDGTLTYAPASGGNGAATVTVLLVDDGGTADGGNDSSSEQTFTIDVMPNFGEPVAVDDVAVTGANVAVVIPVLDNDLDPDGDPLTVIDLSMPGHGIASTDGTAVTYTPDSGYDGIDTLIYTVSDGGLTDTAQVTVYVGDVNRAPVLDSRGEAALSDMDEDLVDPPGTRVAEIIASVLPLDMIADLDGDEEGIAIVDLDDRYGSWQFSLNDGSTWSDLGSPSSGAARLLASDGNSRVRFLPHPDFYGTVDAGLVFRAWDRHDGSNGDIADTNDNGGITSYSTETEIASLTVLPVNDPPRAVDDTANTLLNMPRTVAVLGNDSDPEGDDLSILVVGLPGHGAASIGIDHTLTYTPNHSYVGTDVFTYTIGDAPGLTDTATVSVTVGAANSAPVATNDEGRTSQNVPLTISVLDNDVDPDGDTLIVTRAGAARNGDLTVDGPTVTYVPNPTWTGTDSFFYDVSDGALTDTAQVTVTVAGSSNAFWERDLFDDLSLGALAGQNGWHKAAPNRASAQVVAGLGGQVLLIDPQPGETIVMGKDLQDQSSGRHRLSFEVMVSGSTNPAEPSLAKIEVRKARSQGWDKKFQLYFGPSMRVNYGPRGEAAIFVPDAETDRWYSVRVEIDLAHEQLDLWVDDSLMLSGIPMHPGPITDLGLSGWDRPGQVYLDRILGFQTYSPEPGPAVCPASSFDAGDEGWRVVGDAQGGSVLPDFIPWGGNPGGYVSATDDVLGGTWYWQAPDAFLGDRSASYGQLLTFDLRQSQTNYQFVRNDDLILTDGNLTLIFHLPYHPDTDWTSYSISLDASSGWQVQEYGRAPTPAEMQDVLASLTDLRIRGEYRNGSDTGGLDNVILHPADCPAQGQTAYWINPDGGSWDAAENWDTQVVPDANTDAMILVGGEYTVWARGETQVGHLVVGGGSSKPTLIVYDQNEVAGTAEFIVYKSAINAGTIALIDGSVEGDEVYLSINDSFSLWNRGALRATGTRTYSYRSITGRIRNYGILHAATDVNMFGQVLNWGNTTIGPTKSLMFGGRSASYVQKGGVFHAAGSLQATEGASLVFGQGSYWPSTRSIVGTRNTSASTIFTSTEISGGALHFEPQATGIAGFALGDGSLLSGDIGAEQSVWIADKGTAQASAIISDSLTNAGRLVLETDGAADESRLWIVSGTLTNTGLVATNAGGGGSRVIQGPGTVINQGLLRLDLESGQDLDLIGTSLDNASLGVLQGSGTIDLLAGSGPMTSAGQIRPGLSLGTLHIDGDLHQEATSHLGIEIGGPPAGTAFDQLQISGHGILSGTLYVSLVDDFEPDLGDSYEIVTCSPCLGAFAAVGGLEIDDAKVFEVTYTTNAVILEVVERPEEWIYLPVVWR
jgi:hypothetical protein